MKESIEQCCNRKSIVFIEYDLGCLGKKIFKVCQEHFQKEPWNHHIVSTTKIKNEI